MFDLLGWDRDQKVNSGYGPRDTGIPGASKNHKGIDLSSDDYNIYSVLSGTVIKNEWNDGRGWFVTIRNDDGYTNTYQHFASKSPLAIGSKVKEGQIIGTQGHSGISGGDHLHYEVKSPSGLYVNPLDYLSGKLTGDTNKTTLTNGATLPLTDAHGRPVSNAQGSGGADNINIGSTVSNTKSTIMGIVGDLITAVAILLIVCLAVVLFMKAFDVKIF